MKGTGQQSKDCEHLGIKEIDGSFCTDVLFQPKGIETCQTLYRRSFCEPCCEWFHRKRYVEREFAFGRLQGDFVLFHGPLRLRMNDLCAKEKIKSVILRQFLKSRVKSFVPIAFFFFPGRRLKKAGRANRNSGRARGNSEVAISKSHPFRIRKKEGALASSLDVIRLARCVAVAAGPM